MSRKTQQQRVDLSELTGMPVRGPEGELLGTIEDLRLRMNEGAVDSARLRISKSPFGRALRLDLPWSLLRLHAGGQHLVLDIGLPTLVAVALRRLGQSDD